MADTTITPKRIIATYFPDRTCNIIATAIGAAAAIAAIAIGVVMPPAALPFIGAAMTVGAFGVCATLMAGMSAAMRRETERMRGGR